MPQATLVATRNRLPRGPFVGATALRLFSVLSRCRLPIFWGLPTSLLGGTSAAAGIAFINSFGNLSGFSAPYLIGVIKDMTHSTDAGLHLLAALLFAGAVLVLAVRAERR